MFTVNPKGHAASTGASARAQQRSVTSAGVGYDPFAAIPGLTDRERSEFRAALRAVRTPEGRANRAVGVALSDADDLLGARRNRASPRPSPDAEAVCAPLMLRTDFQKTPTRSATIHKVSTSRLTVRSDRNRAGARTKWVAGCLAFHRFCRKCRFFFHIPTVRDLDLRNDLKPTQISSNRIATGNEIVTLAHSDCCLVAALGRPNRILTACYSDDTMKHLLLSAS